MHFELIVSIVISLAVAGSDAKNCHGHEPHDCVEKALEHVNWGYDKHVCNEIMKLECATYHVESYDVGTEGDTEENDGSDDGVDETDDGTDDAATDDVDATDDDVDATDDGVDAATDDVDATDDDVDATDDGVDATDDATDDGTEINDDDGDDDDADDEPQPADESICGTDGVTYATHCTYAQARCRLILDPENQEHHHQVVVLDIENYGACAATLEGTTPTTPSIATDTASLATEPTMLTSPTAVSGPTDMTLPTEIPTPHTTVTDTPDLYNDTVDATTAEPSVAIETDMFTEAPELPITTTMSVDDLIAKVFCSNLEAFDCSGVEAEVLCASDGGFYPNRCEMTMVMCTDPTLHIMDPLFCLL